MIELLAIDRETRWFIKVFFGALIVANFLASLLMKQKVRGGPPSELIEILHDRSTRGDYRTAC